MEHTPVTGPRCPLCGNLSEDNSRPFCSRRCADIDLGRWLKGVYRIPSEETPNPDAAEDDA